MPLITIEVDGKHNPTTSKGDFTLQYLEGRQQEYLEGKSTEEGAYVKEIYDAWVDLCIRIGKKPGSYKNFRTAIWNLKNEGPIEFYREEEVYGKWKKHYYRIAI